MLKYLFIILTLCCCGVTQAKDYYLSLKTADFSLLTYDFFNENLNFNSLPENRVIDLTFWSATPSVEIKYDHTSLPIVSHDNETAHLHLKFQQQVKTISFNIQTNPAHYSQKYMQRHKGKVSIEIPEVYELSNIILALSDKFYDTQFKMHSKGEYYEDMLQWFAPFKDHDIFTIRDDLNYYSFVENGPAYVFNGDKIQRSHEYHGFRAKDNINSNISLLEDFANKSDFKTFYKLQTSYYAKLSETFRLGAQPEYIWRWLESHFPTKYHSLKVFFSPLGPGNNSARQFSNNGFDESILFISAPNRYENTLDPLPIQFIKFTRSFFTEIDHAYVNPTSDKYIDEINAAFTDLSLWYKGGSYNKPYLVFNEYMTWSLFSLYALENYPSKDYLFIQRYIQQFMVTRKGFHQFKAFNQELTRQYRLKTSSQKIVDLYPTIIAWIKNYSINS
ncbi:DUF4932 domain-containing protein [uncultured Paraglaciecola sp.]|uniref:DUF4932 domain-containing protein n=1 Tax=uncultured Paraglaciecola sp. TaxID=1765024 RepID=UPI002609609B|nr:DUF4932 domain-containing protein [uncultured Paraglaciecola sp.]